MCRRHSHALLPRLHHTGCAALPLPLQAGQNLKLIGRAGAGTDNIDKPAATKAGVVVMNTPGGNTRSAAELTVSLMLSVARRLPQAVSSLKAGRWERSQHKGVELRGKAIAIVGVGAIGREVARWAQALGMQVLGYDPALTAQDAEELGIEKVDSLDSLWGAADVVSLHVPGEGTRHMVGAAELAAMRPGAVLINVARGGVIDPDALLGALESGHLGGAGLDVYPTEPPPPSMTPLLQHPRVVCTPHLGASTEEAQVKVAVDIAAQIRDALAGKAWTGVVNAPHIALAGAPASTPLVALATSLGSLVAQITGHVKDDPITGLKVQLVGGGMTGPTVPKATQAAYRQLLGAAAARGALPAARPSVRGDTLNLVSATHVSEEQGIPVQVAELDLLMEYVSGAAAACESGLAGHPLLVRVAATTASGAAREVTGTVEGGKVRVVQVDAWPSFPAFTANGHVALLSNVDRPGAVAAITQELAGEGVNIAFLGVARQQEGAPALTVVVTDSKLPKSLQQRLIATGEVSSISVASLA